MPNNIFKLEQAVEKAAPVGHISHRKDGDYKKQSDGKWIKVTDGKEPKQKEPKQKEPVKQSPERKFPDYTGDPEYAKLSEESLSKLSEKSLGQLENYQTDSSEINRCLRKSIEDLKKQYNYTDTEIKKVREEGYLIDQAFKETPINGFGLPILYRGGKMSAEKIKALKEGSTFVDRAFVSTSSDENMAGNFLQSMELYPEEEKILFKIKDGQSKAIPLANLQKEDLMYAKEKEFLLNRNTR